MDISYYLKRPKAETETSIFARISYEGYQLKYYISEKINPKNWNKAAQKAKQSEKFKEYPEFNQRLKDVTSDIRTTYRKYLNDNEGLIPSPETLKILLDKELKKKELEQEKIKTLFGFFNDLINQTKNGGRLQPGTGKPYSLATIQVYNNTLNRLKSFEAKYRRKIDFPTIDIDFYTDFTEYLSKELKLASNTIGKDIKTLKTILNEATERGLNNNLQYRSRKFSTTSEKTDSIYLTETELQEMENLDLSENRKLDSVRDLFLIGCYTGLRYSDFSKLTPEHIKDGFIEITQTKTGEPVVIPVHKTVKKILEKYGSKLPPAISNQKTNKYLKDLGELLPCLNNQASKTLTKGGMRITTNYEKWQLLTTHTARRSFATNEYLNGTPTVTIMAITGHKTEKAFLRYIKLTPNEHAKLLKTHWDNRANLKAV